MDSEPDPYARQRRLPEIGERGQSCIERAQHSVSEHPGSIVEFLYLHRAGVQRVALHRGPPTVPFAHGGCFRFDASRAVGEGAWRALAQIRHALGLDEP